METEVYLAKGDVTDEIVGGSGVVCLLGDQRRNTSRRGTIFNAGIRLLLIRRIVFFSNSSLPPPITPTAVLLTRDLNPWVKTTPSQKKLLIVLFAFVIIFTYTVIMVL